MSIPLTALSAYTICKFGLNYNILPDECRRIVELVSKYYLLDNSNKWTTSEVPYKIKLWTEIIPTNKLYAIESYSWLPRIIGLHAAPYHQSGRCHTDDIYDGIMLCDDITLFKQFIREYNKSDTDYKPEDRVFDCAEYGSFNIFKYVYSDEIGYVTITAMLRWAHQLNWAAFVYNVCDMLHLDKQRYYFQHT
jgi:hypothetical protein